LSVNATGSRRRIVVPDNVPPLRLASDVTTRHGRIFAKLFLAAVAKTEVPGEAFNMTGVMEWPSGADGTAIVARWRHERIEDEIMRRIFQEVEEPLFDAFVSIAGEVIERERQRQGEIDAT
jgi:hypothetical protein